MTSLSAFLPDGMTAMPELGTRPTHTPTAPCYVIEHARGGLHWHTPQGDHYADLAEVSPMMSAGEHIRPRPVPAGIIGADELLPEANVVPDADRRIVGLVEYAGPRYYVSQWYDLHRVMTREADEAPLIPVTRTQFRELI